VKDKLKKGLLNGASLVMLLGTIIIIILGVNKAKEESKKISDTKLKQTSSQVKVQDKQPTATSTTKPVSAEQPATLTNPYEKIKNKKEIEILIIGDNIAQSEGVPEESKWHTLLGKAIEGSYGAKVNFKQLTGSKQVVTKALEDYNKQEAANKYDFVILCLGEYDIVQAKLEDFKKNYEALIRKIKTGNPNCEVIPLIESSIQNNKTFPNAIKELADYYELPLIDERESFKQSKVAYDKLMLTPKEKIIPNKEGYKLYADSIFNSVKGNVENGKKVKALDKVEIYKN
jgi:lysophospholipase L1-like esterase